MVDPEEKCTDPEGCTQEKIDAGECCKEKSEGETPGNDALAAAPDYSPGPGKVGPGDEDEDGDGGTKEE